MVKIAMEMVRIFAERSPGFVVPIPVFKDSRQNPTGILRRMFHPAIGQIERAFAYPL